MTTPKHVPHLLPKERPPSLRRAVGGVYRSRLATRLLVLLALALILFGGVGIETCFSESAWEKHLWLPSVVIVLGAFILFSALLHTVRVKLFGR